MKMVKYMKNENFIFFLMEYIKGKELWEVIRDIGLLNKEQTQFYSGSMLLAINYLHKKKVIYRDIKPENIMVNDIGYIKIIDFGTVKEIKERTSTIIGTPHYMAPEIVKGGGYTFQVDIWSIAVCMYEFFCGKLPFADDYDDPMMVYKSVMTEELEFPHYIHDEPFKNLLQKMLRKSPANRLWKFQQIKQDLYFKGFDWNKLISLSLVPPYKIKFKDDKDKIQSIPYLAYFKGKDVKQIRDKGKKSVRGAQFEKWFNEF
jgi:cGMP-dependent protein kinase